MIYQLLLIQARLMNGQSVPITVARPLLTLRGEGFVKLSPYVRNVEPDVLATSDAWRGEIRLSRQQYDAVKGGDVVTVLAPSEHDLVEWLWLLTGAWLYGSGLWERDAVAATIGVAMLLLALGLAILAGWLSLVGQQRWLLRWLAWLAIAPGLLVPLMPLRAAIPVALQLALVVLVLGLTAALVIITAVVGTLEFVFNREEDQP